VIAYLSEDTLRDGGPFSQWFYLIAHRLGGECDRELSRITRSLYGHDAHDQAWNQQAAAARRRQHLSALSASPSVSRNAGAHATADPVMSMSLLFDISPLMLCMG
jgi:hypothetical protein